ncbi:MAG: lysophospholipid acyltransferase family protein [Gammaproteobacteria bacterium]
MKNWFYKPSPSMDKTISEKLVAFPREADMTHSIFRYGWNIVLRTFLKVYFRLDIIGEENLPKDKTFLLIANHTSHLDSLCLSAAVPLHKVSTTYSVAAKEYFFSSFLKSLFSAVFVNAIPFDRHAEKRKSLETCAKTLNEKNQVLIMFPEGTRAKDGVMNPFKKGIGILTAGTDHIVVPAYIKDAHRAWGKGSILLKPHKVTIIIGKPMQFNEFPSEAQAYETIAATLQTEVVALKNLLEVHHV